MCPQTATSAEVTARHYLSIYLSIYLSLSLSLSIHIYIYNIHIHIYIYAWSSHSTPLSIYLSIFTYIIYMYIYIYIHIYIYTYMSLKRQPGSYHTCACRAPPLPALPSLPAFRSPPKPSCARKHCAHRRYKKISKKFRQPHTNLKIYLLIWTQICWLI